MTDPLTTVRRAARRRGDADAAFRAAIVAAHDAGLSYRSIATAADLSFQRVAQIVNDVRAQSDDSSDAIGVQV